MEGDSAQDMTWDATARRGLSMPVSKSLPRNQSRVPGLRAFSLLPRNDGSFLGSRYSFARLDDGNPLGNRLYYPLPRKFHFLLWQDTGQSMRCFILFLLAANISSVVVCQEKDANLETIELNRVFDKILEERSKPLAFEVSASRRIHSKAMVKNDEWMFFITDLEWDIKFDELPGLLYVKQRSKINILNLASAPDSTLVEQDLKLMYPDYIRVVGEKGQFYLSEGEFKAEKKVRDVRTLLPFRLELFGLGMPADLTRPDASLLKTIAQNKQYYGKGIVPLDNDGIATLDLGNQIIRIDTKRDYWPLAFLRESRRTIKGVDVRDMNHGTKMELTKVGEKWVPKKVELTLINSSESFTFDWKSFDAAIDGKYFDVDAIIASEKAIPKPSGMRARLQAK